jgi:diacylglycerol kinase family enzyme
VAIGRQANDPRNNYFETTELTVTADPPQRITLDGEPGGITPVIIRVVPEALRVFVPAAYLKDESLHH